MFDIGWTEMMVVAVVAILFVGPKELPGMLRTFGRSVKKIRALAGDFQRQFDDALKETELDGVKDAINDVRNLDPTKQIKDKLNPLKQELDDVKKDLESDYDYDPEDLFDAGLDPVVAKAEPIDVDAALERQKEIDAAKPKLPPSSGKNAVPGFGGEPAPSDLAAEKAAKPKTTKPKAKAAKSSALATAKKTAAKKAPAKPAAAKPKQSAAKKTVAAKPKTAGKPATKKTAAKKTAAKQKAGA